MTLDVNSPRGQATLAQEDAAAALLKDRTGIEYMRTPKLGPAGVDAVLMKGGDIVGVAEMKCRVTTRVALERTFHNEWLVTYDKVRKVSDAARLLGVPGVGLLFLVPDRELLVVRLCDDDGQYALPMRIDRTETQATVNGGKAKRVNAYIDVSGARRYTL